MKPRFSAIRLLLNTAVLALLLTCLAQLRAQSLPQGSQQPPHTHDPLDTKLPSGKSQRDEILKADHQKNLEETQQLAKLAEELRAEIEKTDKFVLSMSAVKKTEEIEKLVKRIRGRLKRF